MGSKNEINALLEEAKNNMDPNLDVILKKLYEILETYHATLSTFNKPYDDFDFDKEEQQLLLFETKFLEFDEEVFNSDLIDGELDLSDDKNKEFSEAMAKMDIYNLIYEKISKLYGKDKDTDTQFDHYYIYYAHKATEFRQLIEKRSTIKDIIRQLLDKNKFSKDNQKTIAEIKGIVKKTDDIKSETEKISTDVIKLEKQSEDAEQKVLKAEHRVIGHAMTLMGVLTAIIAIIVSLTSISFKNSDNVSFFHQFIYILGSGIIIICAIVILLLLSAYFFSEEGKKNAKGPLIVALKTSGVILYSFAMMCVIFYSFEYTKKFLSTSYVLNLLYGMYSCLIVSILFLALGLFCSKTKKYKIIFFVLFFVLIICALLIAFFILRKLI